MVLIANVRRGITGRNIDVDVLLQKLYSRMRYQIWVTRMGGGAAKVLSYHCAELGECPKPNVLCKPVDGRL